MMIKKSILCVMVLLLSVTLLLSGCKSRTDQQNGTEAPATAATEANYGYDTTSPKSAEWFDNAVFVGDSVTLKLSYYCASHPEALGAAAFYCAGSLGYTNALWELDDPEAVHPYYQGETHLTEDCAQLTGKDNVFIMFGKESAGIPEEILVQHPDHCIRIPMKPEERSLNLSNAVSIVAYEAMRQMDFPELEDSGNLHRLSWDDEI